MILSSLLSALSDPVIRKLRLLFRAEPVLAVFRHSRICIVPSGKCVNGLTACQMVMISAENLRRHIPADRAASHMAEDNPGTDPRQSRRGSRFQLRLIYICPLHHIAYQLLHINYGGYEACFMDYAVDACIDTEECADAVGDQDDVCVFVFQLSCRRINLRTGFPRRECLAVQAENPAAGKQRPAVLTFGRAAVFSMPVKPRLSSVCPSHPDENSFLYSRACRHGADKAAAVSQINDPQCQRQNEQ